MVQRDITLRQTPTKVSLAASTYVAKTGEPLAVIETGEVLIGDGVHIPSALPSQAARTDAKIADATSLPALAGSYYLDGSGNLDLTRLPDINKLVGTMNYVDVERFRNLNGTDASDSVCLQLAVSAARALDIKRVLLSRNYYAPRAAINMGGANGLRVVGGGMSHTKLKVTGQLSNQANTLSQLFNATSAVEGLTFADFAVEGMTNDVADSNTPQRSRTLPTGYGGLGSAFYFLGSLDPGGSLQHRNIRIQRVAIRHACTGLPIYLRGILGDAEFSDGELYNTLDPGWIFCERAVGRNSSSTNGCDNGWSFSRGNRSVEASNLRTYNCAGYGHWIAGFAVNGDSTDFGPTNISASNLHTETAGLGGLNMMQGAMQGQVQGVYVRDVRRGLAEGGFGDADAGIGMRFGGAPFAAPNRYAGEMQVSDYTLIDCSKGGVMYAGAKRLILSDGLIIRPGTTNDYTGTTVASSNLYENFGVVADNSGPTCDSVGVNSLTVIDDRSTPVANRAVYHGGTTNAWWRNVTGIGTRVAVASNKGDYTLHDGTQQYSGVSRHVGGATAGAGSTTSGNADGYNVNGGAGSRRRYTWQTAAVDRWSLDVTGTAETGSDAGSNLELLSKTDAGATKDTLLSTVRSSGVATWAKAVFFQSVAKMQGGVAYAFGIKTGSFNFGATEHIAVCNFSAAGNATLPLIATVGTGRLYEVANVSASAVVTALPNTGQTVSGTAAVAAATTARFIATDSTTWTRI